MRTRTYKNGKTLRVWMNCYSLFVLLFLALASAVYGQKQPEQIYIGGTLLRIGTAKDAAISQLAEKGYHLSKLEGTETWVVSQKNEHNEFDAKGSLTFTNGRLTYAYRYLVDATDPGSAKVGRNLYFLIKSFEDAGNTACTIETQAQETPEFDSKAVLIRCGQRTASVSVSKYKDQATQTSVYEQVK